MLPRDFPQKYSFHLKAAPAEPPKEEEETKGKGKGGQGAGADAGAGKSLKGKEYRFEYPTTILNRDVHKRCTNDQYLEYDPLTKTFKKEVRNEVYFELDGPWKAMFLPASEKSDDLLKKR